MSMLDFVFDSGGGWTWNLVPFDAYDFLQIIQTHVLPFFLYVASHFQLFHGFSLFEKGNSHFNQLVQYMGGGTVVLSNLCQTSKFHAPRIITNHDS